MRIVICWMMRALFLCGGFHHLKVKGRKAETKDAPVLALAPHSSFFDALPVVYLGGPSIVAKGESRRLPFFGSRSSTIKLLSNDDDKSSWPIKKGSPYLWPNFG